MLVIELTESERRAFAARPGPAYWAGAEPDCPAGMEVYPGADGVTQEARIYLPADQPFLKLTVLMDLLIGPNGCPWDQKQTHETLVKYLIEETYETVDAIESGDADALAEELGDLILQPVFHAALAHNNRTFHRDAPLRAICDKLIRRHPHVFGDTSANTAEEVLKNWDAMKKSERADRPTKSSILGGIPRSMPALLRAHEISTRAARAGFEWPDIQGVVDKLHEEVTELEEALAGDDVDAVTEELGDLLFTAVNVARWRGIDSEQALRRMLDRFQARFSEMELQATKPLGELSPDEWDQLWQKAKLKTQSPSRP